MKRLTFFITLLCSSLLLADHWNTKKESVIDTKNKLEWQDTKQIDTFDDKWEISQHHCSGLRLGGHTDWRLPNNKELIALAKNEKEKKHFKHLDKQVFWTSQTDPDNEVNAFAIYIGNGHLSSNDVCDTSRVICVRYHP